MMQTPENTVPEDILQRTAAVIGHWQLALTTLDIPPPRVKPGSARFQQQIDPSDQSVSWFGEWRDRSGMKQGEITLRADGSVFCEYDVLKPHPQKPGWWIEAITSWGAADALKTEFRLLPVPE